MPDRFPYDETVAEGINDRGQIVGRGAIGTKVVGLRFADGRAIPLESEVTNLGDWDLRGASAVNDAGIIVGTGKLKGRFHGDMLVPRTEAADGSAK